MGCWISKCCAQESSAQPDPITGLTGRDVKLIRETWKQMERQNIVIPIGAELFATLLEEYPHTRQYFESFVMETSLGTETNKMKLNDHSQLFMKGIKMYLDYIDEPDALVGLLQTVALDHLDRLISTEEMMELTGLLLRILKSRLGQKFGEETEMAWKKFFRFMNGIYQKVEERVIGISLRRQSLQSKTGERDS